jgi:hypothetical protein
MSAAAGGAAADPAARPHPVQRLLALAVAALLLVWPGFWNGYPLVFADTGTYLSQALQRYLGWDRPPFYSVFLLATHWRLTLWLPMLAQGLILAHLLGLTLRALGRPEPLALVLAAFGLALLTGLPWVAAQLIPDLFTGMLVLCLWLLGFRMTVLSVPERLWLLLLTTITVAVHQSHLPLTLGLALLGGAVLLVWRGWRPALSGMVRMAVPPLLAAVALVAVNLAGHGRAALSPYGAVFVATRLIYDGPGLAMLRQACPEAGYRICPLLDRLSPWHNHFLWEPDGTLYGHLGGPKAWTPEANAIIAETLRVAPLGVVLALLRNTAEQLRMIDTGDGLEPWVGAPGPEPVIAQFFAHELPRFQSSRQHRGLLLQDARAITPLYRTVDFLGLLALLALPLLRRRLGIDLPGLALGLFVLTAALGNAAITGGLSGPAHRYQARLAWLFAFTPAAVLASSEVARAAVASRRGAASGA